MNQEYGKRIVAALRAAAPGLAVVALGVAASAVLFRLGLHRGPRGQALKLAPYVGVPVITVGVHMVLERLGVLSGKRKDRY